MAGEAISTGLASPQILTEEEQVVVATLVASRPRVVTAVVRPRVEEGDTLPGQVPPHPPPIQAHLLPTLGAAPLRRRGTRRLRSGTCIR